MNEGILNEKIYEAFKVIKYYTEKIINEGHYIPMPEEVLKNQDEITDKYIMKRFTSIVDYCPYKIKFDAIQDGSILGTANRYKIIKILDCYPHLTQFEILLHEWTHIILHCRRNAVKKNEFEEELEAESVSFIVGYVLGHIDEYSHDYICQALNEINKNKEGQLKLLNDTYRKSERRIINTAIKILDKLNGLQRQLEYHRRSNGEKLF